MAKSHPGIEALTRYLRTDFPWKKDWECEVLNTTFKYEEVKEALRRLKKTDPRLHRFLEYRWMTNRSRSAIANALYLDSSTLKRLTHGLLL